MGCPFQPNCGGCCFRHMSLNEYREAKTKKVKDILDAGLVEQNYCWENPIFLSDGTRRRAALTFQFKNNSLTIGFNENRSSEIAPYSSCPMMTPKLNGVIPSLKGLLAKLCAVGAADGKRTKKISGHAWSRFKEKGKILNRGDILLLDADNGIDIVLEADFQLSLEHRMDIFDYVQAQKEIIRFSVRRTVNDVAEPIVEKLKPFVAIAGFDVYVAPGTFLQASKDGEHALIGLVQNYLGETSGNIADLFCGIGTFSYPLSKKHGNKITAVDSSQSLLEGFKMTVNRQMIHNIDIFQRNLFKYPLTAEELAKFSAVIFDPPRAGAKAQVQELAQINEKSRPEKIIAVSCNPHSFAADANVLISSGYKLQKVTMVDQFVYSNHSELAALFTN